MARAVRDAERLENDPRFLHRVEEARKSLRAGRGVKLEDIELECDADVVGNGVRSITSG
jgi:hypothetical protein